MFFPKCYANKIVLEKVNRSSPPTSASCLDNIVLYMIRMRDSNPKQMSSPGCSCVGYTPHLVLDTDNAATHTHTHTHSLMPERQRTANRWIKAVWDPVIACVEGGVHGIL